DRFVIVGVDALSDPNERKRVLEGIRLSGRELIPIDLKQLEQFAGNVLQVQTREGRSVLVISTSACLALRPEQRHTVQKCTQMVESPCPLLEGTGRGSERGMMADVHLPRR